MQVSVENIGKLERRMQVQVPAEQVSKEIASRLKTISRTARDAECLVAGRQSAHRAAEHG
jgi:hypothetical protein